MIVTTVAVIGGGITGMSVMHYLKKNDPSLKLVLIEKEAQLGGKMITKKENNFILELGADSIVARHKSVQPLIEELGLQKRAVYNSSGVSYILTDNELHALPVKSVFGIPMNEEVLAQSTLISEEGKKAALRDLTIPNTTFTEDDSIGAFLEFFLGKELVEKQIAPVLSGVYSGDLYTLSIASTLPYILKYKNEYGSIMRGLEANEDTFMKAAAKKFISFEDGLVELFDTFEKKLHDATILKNTETTAVIKKDTQYEICIKDGQSVYADYVVLATPHQVAASLLREDTLTESFDAMRTSSIMTVYLGFDVSDDVLPADGTGYIVAKGNDLIANACTWTSRKWRNTSKEGKLLVRLFYKKINPRFEQLSQMSDAQLAEVALQDVRDSLHINAIPSTVEISRWMDAMPVYSLAHHKLVENVVQTLKETHPNVLLAGCSYYGVGIGLCIENGKQIAEQIVAQLSQ